MSRTTQQPVARKTRTVGRIIFLLPVVMAIAFFCLKLFGHFMYMKDQEPAELLLALGLLLFTAGNYKADFALHKQDSTKRAGRQRHPGRKRGVIRSRK